MKKQIILFLLTGTFMCVFAQAPSGWGSEAHNIFDNGQLSPSLQINVNPATCAGSDGSIEVQLHFITLSVLSKPDLTLNDLQDDEYAALHPDKNAFWKLTLTGENNVVAEKKSALFGSVLFSGLAAGTYTFELIGKHGYRMQQNIAVKGPPVVTADFEMNFASVQVNDAIYFRNRSQGATVYQWNFGDGSPVVDIKSPSHYYKLPGIYAVTLTALNNECAAEKTAYVKVGGNYPNTTTGVADNEQDEFYAYAGDDAVSVVFHFAHAVPARLSIFDLSGRELAREEIITTGVQRVSLPFAAEGFLLARLELSGKYLTKKLLVSRN